MALIKKKLFFDNCCRLCSKTFCCVKCRIRHESKTHQVNPDCEICIYGRATIKEASVSLLSHIKEAHWPLHCVFCKKVFNSVDELLPHEKCTMKIEPLKMQGTPKTPVSDNDKLSPEVTPFYKSLHAGGKKCAVTSTPLVVYNTSEKITPTSQIIPKSNLKLTGSSSIKNERRVTFVETPFMEGAKKSKTFPLDERTEEKDSSDDSFCSVEEIFKSAAEDKENKVVALLNRESTLWETALNKSDMLEPVNKTNINVSLQINVFNNTNQTPENCSTKPNDESQLNKSTNLWSSMTSIVKSVVTNISMSAQNSFAVGKRRPLEDASDVPSLKRMKLTDIKCRRPIRDLSSCYQIKLAKPRFVDKATQTDESWG